MIGSIVNHISYFAASLLLLFKKKNNSHHIEFIKSPRRKVLLCNKEVTQKYLLSFLQTAIQRF